MAASRLGIYNKALRHLEERPLANLTENREPRRLLDVEYDDALATVLQSGYWKHALRTVLANPDVNNVPNFGRQYSYAKPSDWVRTYQLSADDRFYALDRNFVDGNGTWFTDLPTFYVRYISNDPNFGLNMSMWGAAFAEYFGCYLAWTVCPRIKQAIDKKNDLEKTLKQAKRHAIGLDAMDGAAGRLVHDTWVTARTPRGSVLPYGGGWDEND